MSQDSTLGSATSCGLSLGQQSVLFVCILSFKHLISCILLYSALFCYICFVFMLCDTIIAAFWTNLAAV